jgi:hypothetical protein
VLARLLRRGYVASQAPRAWKADDVLGRDDLRIQVKATVNGISQGWLVGDVDAHPRRFYALVDFADEKNAVIYVVPSSIVREAAEASHWEFYRHHPGAKPFSDPQGYGSIPIRGTRLPAGMAGEVPRGVATALTLHDPPWKIGHGTWASRPIFRRIAGSTSVRHRPTDQA